MTNTQSDTLARRWDALLAQDPRLRIRNAAQALGVSEMELLCTRDPQRVTRLAEGWGDWIERMHELGEVMALTRNEHAVHEKHGTYRQVEINGPVGLVLDKEIDLRLFLMRWRYGFAVEEELPKGGLRRSLQFFDARGQALHKVYLTQHSRGEVWERWRGERAHAQQRGGTEVTPAGPVAVEKPDAEVDVEGFQAAWRALQDTHDFFGLLREYGVTRTQGLRLAPPELADPLEVGALRQALEQAARRELPIMIFVGNPGAIQIHTGPVARLVQTGPWFNVLDPRFNLHLRTDAIAQAWRVRKPTEDGLVTSLELFDAQGENIALLFGERKPGVPEDEAWRALVEALPGLQ